MIQRILNSLAVLIVAVIAGSGTLAAESWTTVRIGLDPEFPPFSYADANGSPDGFDVRIARAVCKKMQVKCLFYKVNFDEITLALYGQRAEGSLPEIKPRVDALVMSMWRRPERAKIFAFTDSYYNTPHAIIATKARGLKISNTSDTKGMKVGVLVDSPEHDFARKYFSAATLAIFYSSDELQAGLKDESVDMILQEAVGAYEWTDGAGGSCCAVLGRFEPDLELNPGAGIALRKKDDDLRAMFDEALTLIRADGTYKKINDKYFRFDISGR